VNAQEIELVVQTITRHIVHALPESKEACQDILEQVMEFAADYLAHMAEAD
jgi:molybdopterin biosynthesis enzyme MoaB